MSVQVTSTSVSDMAMPWTLEGAIGGNGSLTVTVASPLSPPAEAVMLATPSATPVTRPDPVTAATVGAEVVQDTVALTTSFRPFRTVARSWVVEAMSTDVGFGETLTLATASDGSGPAGPPQAVAHARPNRINDPPNGG